MKKPTVKKLMAQLKEDFEFESGEALDFRSHAYLDNQYGLSPTFNYSFAEKIVKFAFEWAENYIEENHYNYPDFGGWYYNLQMSIEGLRTTPLKVFLSTILFDLEQYYKPRANVSDFKLEFNTEVEGTYVINVLHREEHFEVNCQTVIDYNYRESSALTCINESGGDFYDSGLNEYVEKRLSDEDIKILQLEIEECAEKNITIKTVEDYIQYKTDLNLTESAGSLVGACYANNCYLKKYTADTGEIVIVDMNDNENIPEKIVDAVRIFDSKKDYEEWFDNATKNHTGNWSGDCSLAYMLWQAL